MLHLILTLCVVGLLLWLALKYIPMADPFPRIITGVVVVCAVLYVLQFFGLLGSWRVGSLR